MSHHNPFTVPAKPEHITLDTLPQLFAHNRARFGGWSMTSTPPEPQPNPAPPAPAPAPNPAPTPPERPEDVTEEEWNALGDPGRVAITRERERRQAAERALAASRARPAPPAPTPPKPNDKPPADPPKDGNVDVAAIVQQAVEAALKPFQEAEQQRATEAAAGRVQTAVLTAAKTVLHDETDALTGIDLASVVNDQGQADPAKVKAALDDLVKRKPHLAKSTERFAPPGIGGGAPAGTTDAEKVKSVLADMQRATGVRLPAPPSTTL